MLFISPRKWAPKGYVDLDIDDYEEGTLLKDIQKEQELGAAPEAGLFLK